MAEWIKLVFRMAAKLGQGFITLEGSSKTTVLTHLLEICGVFVTLLTLPTMQKLDVVDGNI